MYTIDGPIILKFGNAVEELEDTLNRKRCGGSQKMKHKIKNKMTTTDQTLESRNRTNLHSGVTMIYDDGP